MEYTEKQSCHNPLQDYGHDVYDEKKIVMANLV
jgi:hypothetical protein